MASKTEQPSYLRPDPPSPHASVLKVRHYLNKIFQALDQHCNTGEAELQARRVLVDGEGLYDVTEKRWLETFGVQGKNIYQHLYNSRYGYVRTVAFICLSVHL